MNKVVYLTSEQVEQLEAIVVRLDKFGHKNDAAILHNMVEAG